MMDKKTKDFNEILLSSIDEAFVSLGDSVGPSVYLHLERNFVRRNEIPQNLEAFQVGLERIFGVGARFVEILVMRRLHSKINSFFTFDPSEKFDFIEYVSLAKNSFP